MLRKISLIFILVILLTSIGYAKEAPKGEGGQATETDCLSMCSGRDFDSA